jgi:hypothetical protein
MLLLGGACLGATAQTTAQANMPAASDAAHIEQVPRVPGISSYLRGLNAGLTFSGVHDSLIGWYTVATPAVSYAFSRHYSSDASVSIYPNRQVVNLSSAANPTLGELPALGLVTVLGEVGDTFIGLHGSFNRRALRNTATAYFTLPTGDRSNGLGTGKVTFDFSNHSEQTVKRTSFLMDIGAGDSSGLFNNLVTKDYSSIGALAHLQMGVVLWLPGSNYIQSVAYDQLPFGKQTVYSSVVNEEKVGEDDGITTSWGIPLSDHLAITGYYSRSFRQQTNTVSFGMTYLLRGRQRRKLPSMIDKALREAEGASQ